MEVPEKYERMRKAYGWPDNGTWDYDLGLNTFRYSYATGPDKVSITVGPVHIECEPGLKEPTPTPNADAS